MENNISKLIQSIKVADSEYFIPKHLHNHLLGVAKGLILVNRNCELLKFILSFCQISTKDLSQIKPIVISKQDKTDLINEFVKS